MPINIIINNIIDYDYGEVMMMTAIIMTLVVMVTIMMEGVERDE